MAAPGLGEASHIWRPQRMLHAPRHSLPREQLSPGARYVVHTGSSRSVSQNATFGSQGRSSNAAQLAPAAAPVWHVPSKHTPVSQNADELHAVSLASGGVRQVHVSSAVLQNLEAQSKELSQPLPSTSGGDAQTPATHASDAHWWSPMQAAPSAR